MSCSRILEYCGIVSPTEKFAVVHVRNFILYDSFKWHLRDLDGTEACFQSSRNNKITLNFGGRYHVIFNYSGIKIVHTFIDHDVKIGEWKHSEMDEARKTLLKYF